MALPQEVIDALLAKEKRGPTQKASTGRGRKRERISPVRAREIETARNEGRGPIRWYDNSLACQHRGDVYSCGTQTFIRFEGRPLCMVHAIKELNELVIQMQEQKYIVTHSIGVNNDGGSTAGAGDTGIL